MKADTPSPTPGVSDPGLMAALTAGLGSANGTSPGVTNLTTTLTQLLTGRPSLTTQPLVGIMPAWVQANPTLLAATQGKNPSLDPYLVDPKDPTTWRVFVAGSTKRPVPLAPQSGLDNILHGQAAQGPDQTGDRTESVQAVQNQPFTWSADQVKDAIKKFQDAGMVQVNDFDSLVSEWQKVTQAAGMRYSLSSGKLKTTPWDMLEIYKKASAPMPGYNAMGQMIGTRTSVQKTVNEISQGDAWSALKGTLSQMLGRDPSTQEVRDFTYRMNALAAKNPTVSKTTTDYGNGSGNTSSSTHTSAGFDANDIAHSAYDEAQSNPDYAEYQSASTYFNAALSAMGAIGG